MDQHKIKYCPGKLTEGFDTYSPIVLKKMFDGKKIRPFLPYTAPSDSKERSVFNENQLHISISGFQEKYSLLIENSKLRLTTEDERGQYILKPISDLPKNSEFAPANEHLTMQIAQQIFKIETKSTSIYIICLNVYLYNKKINHPLIMVYNLFSHFVYTISTLYKTNTIQHQL